MIEMQPIAYVHSSRKKPVDDSWNEVDSYIQLTPDYAEDCLAGLKDFSHLEVIYYFHKVDKSKIVCTSEHPRENNKWPKVGIFAQRKKARPNLIGATIARLLEVKGTRIFVASLDAIDGTPVFDLKPVFKEFLPDEVRQPGWVSELMDTYW